MKHLLIGLAFALAVSGCARSAPESVNVPAGSDVTVQKKDGVSVQGRLVEVTPEHVLIEGKDGVKTSVPRAQVASVNTLTAMTGSPAADAKPPAAEAQEEAAQAKSAATGAGLAARQQAKSAAAASTGEAPAAPAAPKAPSAPRPDEKADRTPRAPEFREVTVPAGTVLRVSLTTPVASDTSHVEDAVRATLQNAVTVDDVTALPAGTAVLGHVTSAERSGKVKGLASVALRFNSVDLPGDGGRESIQTGTITREATSTKKKDAAKIGIGAGAGAVIGGIVGGGSGAAKGAAIGGGAGTGAVLATRGDEVRLPAGTPLSVKLTAPLTVRVAAK
jgi:hypothetical protein